MASFTAKNAAQLRAKAGTKAETLAAEFASVDAAIDTAKIQQALLTAGMGTRTAVETSGVDLASGSDAVYYGVFHATQAMTITGMVTVLNEAYVKGTEDAEVILKDRAETPVIKCTYTMPAAGREANTSVTTTPASAALAEGDILDLYITASGSTGTGYVDVILLYTID
jgi:hypothetical protein